MMSYFLKRDYLRDFIAISFSKKITCVSSCNVSFPIYSNLWLSVFLIFSLLGVNRVQSQEVQEMDGNIKISEETKQAMNIIKGSRILFAHKSVGNNILSGLKMLSDETGIELNVKKIDNKPIGNKSIFAHSMGGKNAYPKTKIDSFTTKLKALNDELVPEVAFLKLCYVDIKPDTDVNELFGYYKEKIESLKKEKSDTIFVHFTVPLMSKSNSIKSKIKGLLGIQIWEDASNIKRNEFNKLIINSFDRDSIFDIARIESTRIDGSREQFTVNGKAYYSMSPEYTSDGGHLNKLGQQVVATEMVNFLGKTIKKKSTVVK